jgi:iron complex outermembrane receptor protein
MKSIFKLLIFISIAGIQCSHAQNTLSGTINNEQQESVLATIYIPKLERGVVSDSDGRYLIERIPNGIYDVIFSSIGHKSISIKLSFNNSDIEQDITMAEIAIEMEEVIISTHFHKLQSENVMKVDRVSINELNGMGAMNLSDGINSLSGVSTISTGIGIGKPVIRGLSANRVLTYSQGVRLENQQFGDEHGLGINAAGIESVEVIKGPASLLYGSDALGGVLYLNPERFAPTDSTEVDINTRYNSNNHGIGSDLGFKTSKERFKFLVRGAYSSFTDYKTGSGLRVTNSRSNEYDLKSGFQFQGDKIKSTLRYNYNRSNLGIPEEIGDQSTSREIELPNQEIDNHIISLENHFYFNQSSLRVKLGYQLNDRKEFEDEHEHDDDEGEEEEEEHEDHDEHLEPALRMKLNTFNYDLKYYPKPFKNIETILGVQGMFQSNTNFGEEFLIPDANKTDIGAFITAHYHKNSFGVLAGLRYDFRKISSDAARDPSEINYIQPLSRDFSSFNAALGFKYDPVETVTLRLNLASGFRAPNLSELTSNGVHHGTNRYEKGNPDLDNEKNIQTDISLEFNNENINIFANGFYNSVSEYVFLNPTNEILDDEQVFTYLQSDAELYGGEIGFHYHPHPLDWLHLESEFEMVVGELKDGSHLPLIPAHQIKNTVRLTFKDGKRLKMPMVYVTCQNTFSQNDISEFETATDGYNLLSMGAGCSLKFNEMELQLNANISNLTDENYVSHLSRLKADGISNMGRNYNFTLNLKI